MYQCEVELSADVCVEGAKRQFSYYQGIVGKEVEFARYTRNLDTSFVTVL